MGLLHFYCFVIFDIENISVSKKKRIAQYYGRKIVGDDARASATVFIRRLYSVSRTFVL